MVWFICMFLHQCITIENCFSLLISKERMKENIESSWMYQTGRVETEAPGSQFEFSYFFSLVLSNIFHLSQLRLKEVSLSDVGFNLHLEHLEFICIRPVTTCKFWQLQTNLSGVPCRYTGLTQIGTHVDGLSVSASTPWHYRGASGAGGAETAKLEECSHPSNSTTVLEQMHSTLHLHVWGSHDKVFL